MDNYHQDVPAEINRSVTPAVFDRLRAAAVYNAYDQLDGDESEIVRRWAHAITRAIRKSNPDYELSDAIELAGIVAAMYVAVDRRQNHNRLPDQRESIFFAQDPRQIRYEDLTAEEIITVAALRPKQLMRIYNLNLTQANDWYRRARSRARTLLEDTNIAGTQGDN